MYIKKTDRISEEGISGFDWKDLDRPSSRILSNTSKYKDLSIAEAFAAEYGNNLLSKLKMHADITYRDLNVGDVVELTILSVSKNNVVFDSPYKEEIVCNVNLWNYDKFKNNHNITIPCKVMSKTENKIVVDPFAVMFDKWLATKLMDGRRGKEPSYIQYDMKVDRSSIMKDLHLIKGNGNESVKGGYSGRLYVDMLSEWLGQDVYIDAFIPGSQIVLNIESDFTRWEGKNVDVFILNYVMKPGTQDATMSVICSAKEVKKFDGQKRMIEYFNDYAEGNDNWKKLTEQSYDGIVTGVLHRSKICGVFVEIPELDVTGMVEMMPSELVNYHPRQHVQVKWDHFIEPVRYNKDIGQMQHLMPYVIEEDRYLKEFNLKPIFKWAE